jgi:AraC-like DNA-binding protein
MTKQLYFLEPDDTLDKLSDYYFPPYVTLAHMFHAPDGWHLQPRQLKQYQLQYVVEGSALYTIQGHTYETGRGDLIFHTPHELHDVRTKHGLPYVCISIVFHFGSSPFPIQQLLGIDEQAPIRHLLGQYAHHPVESKLSELVHHYRQPGLDHQLRCQSLLLDILRLISHSRREDDDEEAIGKKEDANRAKLILARNYITGRLREGFQHRELEKLTGWSRNYIIIQFRKAFAMSPMQYLIWQRIEKAKELALQSSLSFSQIANEVGYSDIHAFGKIFKKKTGMSLSEFCATLFTDTPDS